MLQSWEELVAHFGGLDELRSAIVSGCAYDYPHVYFDDAGDGPAIVLDAPDSGGAVVQARTFPVTEEQFWQLIDDLDARLIESVEVLDLPHIEHQVGRRATSVLVQELAQVFHIEQSEIVNSIGGSWVSCDDLVPHRHRGKLKWFLVGDPVLAVLGIGRQNTMIAAGILHPISFSGPEFLELGESMEVDTRDLLTGTDDIGVDFLKEVITKTRKRLRLCRGCRKLRTSVASRGGFVELCPHCQSLFTGIIFD